MKRFTYLLIACLPWLGLPCMANASSQAIHIALSTAAPTQLNDSTIKQIRQLVASAVAKGVVRDFVIYNKGVATTNQFFACAQTATASPQFDALVNQLHKASPKSRTINYNLSYAKSCPKDNTLVCADNNAACLNALTISNLPDYLPRQQFLAALADISAGKASMSVKINDDFFWTSSNPADIGLPSSSEHCSQILVSAKSYVGYISCTIKGNPAVNGKNITWTYSLDYFISTTGSWSCSSDVTDTKYTA